MHHQDGRLKQEKGSSIGRINTSPQYSGTVNCSVSLIDSLLSFTHGIIPYHPRKICHKIQAQNTLQIVLMQQNVGRNIFRSKRVSKLQAITQRTLMTELKGFFCLFVLNTLYKVKKKICGPNLSLYKHLSVILNKLISSLSTRSTKQ